MTNPMQTTPGARPETLQPDVRTQPALTPKPLPITPFVSPPATGVPSGAAPKLPTSDTTGEMESAGGGTKTLVKPADTARADVAGTAPTGPAPKTPTESSKAPGEHCDTPKNATGANVSTKQQGC